MLFKKVKTIHLSKEVKQVASGVVSFARGEVFKLAQSFLLGSWLIQFSVAFSTQPNRQGFC